LADAISLALKQSPGLKILESQADSLGLSSIQVLVPASPSLFYSRSNAPGFFSGSPASFSWGINWAFNFPGKTLFDSKQLGLQADAASQTLRAKAIEIESHVRFVYQGLRLKEDILRILSAERHRTRELVRLVENKYKSAKAVQADLLNAQANLGTLEGDILDAENDRNTLLLDFRSTLSVPQNNEIYPLLDGRGEMVTLPEEYTELVKIAEKNQPALKASQQNIHAAEVGQTGASLEFLPDFQLSLFTTQNVRYEARNNSSLAQDYSMIISATVPIFFFVEQRKRTQIAARDLGIAENSALALKLTVISDLRSLFQSYTVSRKKFVNYQTSILPAFKSSYELSLKDYAAGKIDYVRLQENRRSWVNATKEVFDTEFNLYQVLGDIRARLGCILGASDTRYGCS
jgi:outer membrane protein TolC